MIKSLFPTFIYYSPLISCSPKSFNNDLKVEALKFAEIDLAGKRWSSKNYRGGYTSYGSIPHLHKVSTTFETLESEINKHVYKFAKHLEMDINLKELKMSSCWINIMPMNAAHTMHIHPLSVISGTYYVRTPEDCSSIKFEDPRLESFMASPPRKHSAKIQNQRHFSLEPQEGHLVLFESWTRHEVPPNNSKKDRISISFNYDWL